MKLLVGLGNHGAKYAATRHNVGFMAVDLIAEKFKTAFSENICHSDVARAKLDNEEVVLAKPKTYMNRSGQAVAELMDEFSLTVDDLTILHDDIDIALGKIKEKTGGGSAGHNGIESIVSALGTGEFRRIRLGVGRPPEGQDVADYVLSGFESDELETVDRLLEESCRRVVKFE